MHFRWIIKILIIYPCIIVFKIKLELTSSNAEKLDQTIYHANNLSAIFPAVKRKKKLLKPTNVLLILADDLGYGDTSVHPFVGTGISTPNLERMASRGTIMTNFHTAASTCSPTRASILTGLYPWRVGLKAVYEYGEKGKSNRDDWLPQVVTMATTFRDAGYYTGHSGKWHLGGMRNDDLDLRLLPDIGTTKNGGRRCPHPGPNQQGFIDYVSLLDGPGSPRQNHLQIKDTLYSRGCEYLLNNDQPIHQNESKISGFLSHCEVQHALAMMKRSLESNRPFYIQVWFHAPHGPWQEIPGYRSVYPGMKGYSRMDKYKTMVNDMDRNVGVLLDGLHTLGVEKSTLVAFLSDNGPEDGAGGTGGFRGNKRFIYEGGIRVPALFQWIGSIPPGRSIQSFGVTTDLYPTFLEATGVKIADHVSLDGTSLLGVLTSTKHSEVNHNAHKMKHFGSLIHRNESTRWTNQWTTHNSSSHPFTNHSAEILKERVTLWHNDYEGPRLTAAWVYDFKIFLNEKEEPDGVFDMLSDPFEKTNLLSPGLKMELKNAILAKDEYLISKAAEDIHRNHLHSNALVGARSMPSVIQSVVLRMFKVLKEYALFGDEAYKWYLMMNKGRHYNSTIASDMRPSRVNIYKKLTRLQVAKLHEEFLYNNSCGSTDCSCETKSAVQIPPYPFNRVNESRKYLNPVGFLNGTALLKIN